MPSSADDAGFRNQRPFFAIAAEWEQKHEDLALQLKTLQKHQAVALNFLKVGLI